MKIETPVTRVRKALDANEATATSFTKTAVLPTSTEPVAAAGRFVFKRLDMTGSDNTNIRVTPFGRNANNLTLSVKVNGWNRIGQSFGSKYEWQSNIICQVQGTLSDALIGIAGFPVVASDLFCDTLALTYGIAVLYQGLADVDTAWFEFDAGGYEYVDILFARGTATEANALVSF